MLETDTLLANVGKVRSDLAALCSALDPDSVPLPEVTPLWESFDAMERLVAGAKCRLARRVEESRSWADKGARSPAEHLGAISGTTTGRARAALEASKALAALPEADAAVAKGELSDQQARPSPRRPRLIPRPRAGSWSWPSAGTCVVWRPSRRQDPSGLAPGGATGRSTMGAARRGRGTAGRARPRSARAASGRERRTAGPLRRLLGGLTSHEPGKPGRSPRRHLVTSKIHQ